MTEINRAGQKRADKSAPTKPRRQMRAAQSVPTNAFLHNKRVACGYFDNFVMFNVSRFALQGLAFKWVPSAPELSYHNFEEVTVI